MKNISAINEVMVIIVSGVLVALHTILFILSMFRMFGAL